MKKLITPLFILFFAGLCFGQTVNFTYTPTCYGSQTTLAGNSSLPDSDIQTWQWDIDNNGIFDLTGKTILYLFTSTDSVPVRIQIVPVSGPVVSFTKMIFIDPLPNVNFQVDNLCAYKQATYYNQSTISSGSIGQFLWDFNNDGIIDDNSNDTVHYTCGPAQSFVTKLTCVSNKGCSAFATKSTIVYPQPTASFTYSNTCKGQNTTFTNTSIISSPDFFLWNFGDGEASTTTSPSHTYSVTGNYNVELIATTTNGCRDTTQMNVFIMPAPNVAITSSNNDTILNGNGEQIMLYGNGAGNYLWSGGSTNQSIFVNNPGTYFVTATDQNGCAGTDSITIYSVTDNPEAEITLESDILTPNGDGINDCFTIKNIQSYRCVELEIFNMWNDKVFWTDVCYNNNWCCQLNGNGNTLPIGAYYYIIKIDGKITKGCFNIL